MLRLPPFDYLSPDSLDGAVRMLAARGEEAMFVAGGTDLFPNMKRRQMEPRYVIGLSGLRDLKVISNGAGLAIGSGVTLAELSHEERVRRDYSALATAAGLVSTPQLRAMGTLGGNLCLDTRCNYYNQTYWWRKSINFCMKKDGEVCWVAPGSSRCWAVSSSDCAPVVIALGGSLRLVGAHGERTIPAREFYRDDGIDFLAKAPHEILAGISFPPGGGMRSVYLKLRRRGSFDFPILGVAVALRIAPNHEVEDARIVIGGVGSRPLECDDAARILVGQKPSPELIEEAADRAWKPARPLDNTDMSPSYRKKMSRVYVKRALESLTAQE